MKDNDTILALDPSSSVCGYAIGRRDPGRTANDRPHLIEAGRLRGSEARSKQTDPVVAQLINSPAGNATRRIDSIMDDLWPMLGQHQPAVVIIEIPSGKAGSGSKRGAKSSLAIYGMAAGAVYSLLDTWRVMSESPALIVPVNERIWTRYRGNKIEWSARMAAFYRDQYRAADDPGQDISDAIGLLWWWDMWCRLMPAQRAAQLGAVRDRTKAKVKS